MSENKAKASVLAIWQDREVRFDLSVAQLQPRKGEIVIDSINAVEDTKGNNGERGAFSVTNLRMIWCSHRDPKTNLSIGMDCITSLSIRNVTSKIRGNTQALFVMTKFNTSRFEFIFTSLVKNSPRLFTTIQAANRAYETSRLYRDLKLRCAIIKEGRLVQLPEEHVYTRLEGVWNMSAEQSNLGTFFVTNVRVVWHAALAEGFNVSVPYIQIKAVRLRDSKLGNALVLETSALSGNFLLGFRVDSAARLAELHKEVSTLHELFSANPNFGVQYEIEPKAPVAGAAGAADAAAERVEDDAKVVSTADGTHFDLLAAYYSDGGAGGVDREPVYAPELGLAVEKLREGLSLDELWHVAAV